MATPITWQNVAAPQPADVSRPLYLAQNAITSGLTAFGDALKNYEAGQRDVWKRQDADATQSVLDQIYRAGSVEEFNRMNAAGAFDQTRGPNDARIDRAAVNALRDTRREVLQGREFQQFKYNDAVRQNAEAPVLAKGMAMLANRDFTGAFSLLEQLSPQSRALMAGEIDKARQTDVARDRENTKFASELLTAQTSRATDISRADASATNAAAAVEQNRLRGVELVQTGENNAARLELDNQRLGLDKTRAETEARNAEIARLKSVQTNLDSALEKFNTTNAELASSKDGTKSVIEQITKAITDPSDRERVIQKASQLALDPRFQGVTTNELVRAAVASHKTGFFDRLTGNSGDNLEQTLIDLTKTPDFVDRNRRAEGSRGVLARQIGEYQRQLFEDPQRRAPAAGPQGRQEPGANTSSASPAVSGSQAIRENRTPTSYPDSAAGTSEATTPAATQVAGLPGPAKKSENPFTRPQSNVWTPELLGQYKLEQSEMGRNGPRKAFSTEIQAAINAGANEQKAFDAELNKRREELSKSLGIPIPSVAGTARKEVPGFLKGFLGPTPELEKGEAQKRKEWEKAMDRRIQSAWEKEQGKAR